MPCSDCKPAFTSLRKLSECKLLSRLRSNQAATLFEHDELNSLVSHAEKELVDYDNTLARLRETIISLENEKKRLNRQVDLAKSLMAPIRKLPPEILRKIFIAHASTNYISPKVCNIPGLTIASTCSHWRSIVTRTTALWNNISLRLENGCQWHPHHVVLVETLLQLSDKSSLFITIDSPSDVAVIPPFFSLLCDQADRWQSLHGSGISTAVLNALSPIQGRLHSLHTFNLIAFFENCRTLVEGAQKVQTLTVSRMSGIHNAAIPWTQLTRLDVWYSLSSDIVSLLAESVNLQSLKISCYYPERFDPTSNPEQPVHRHLTLTVLEFFIYDYTMHGHLARSLDLLDLPKLQHFSVMNISLYPLPESKRLFEDGLHWSSKQLPSFLARSSEITTFSLDNVWVDTDALIILLQRLPALTSLSLSEPVALPMLNDTFLASISGHGHKDGQPLLPRLTSLILEGYTLSFSMPVFVDVVCSRWKSFSHIEGEIAVIKSVKLKIKSDKISPVMVQSLITLEKRGLDISIKDQNGDILTENRIGG